MIINRKEESRLARKKSIRKTLTGSTERPRLSVYKSNVHIYAQVIDDSAARTLVFVSTRSPDIKGELKGTKKKDQAKKVGVLLAKKCLDAKIDKVVFDRNGFVYHGRVAAVADGAREGGLKF